MELGFKQYFLIVFVILIETLTLSLFKSKRYLLASLVIYGLVGLGLNYIIGEKGLVAGHALYDFLGILVISLVGIFYFKEKVTPRIILGLILGALGVYLLDKPHSHH